ncbi:MAG: MFS transporter, partial [Elusimicrobiota bacterium]
MRDDVKKIVRLYYGFQFFFPLLLWLPVFYEYQKRMGLNDHQIFGIQSLYYLAFFLLEIPTGFFADVWGYRQSMRVGAATLVLSNLLPIFWTS